MRLSHLSTTIREVLIDHLDGAVCYTLSSKVRGSVRRDLWRKKQVIKPLIDAGLLRRDGDNYYTRMTAKGETALRVLIAEYADAMLRVAYRRGGMDNPAPGTHIRVRRYPEGGHGLGSDRGAHQEDGRRHQVSWVPRFSEPMAEDDP